MTCKIAPLCKPTLMLVLLLSPPAIGADAVLLPLNPAVTPATIATTICAPGWSRKVRPAYSVSHAIKLAKLRAAGLAPSDISRFELDHRIPISLGGAPADPRNLDLEPWAEADRKDDAESCLAAAVCDGRLGLTKAQETIWRDWRAAARMCH